MKRTSTPMQRVAAALLSSLLATACSPRSEKVAGQGDPESGRKLIAAYDCGSCHRIPGVRAARGVVGPPLDAFARRSFIAGRIPNTRDNLVAWVQDPPRIDPWTAMPSLGLTAPQARDIAAYLGELQ